MFTQIAGIVLLAVMFIIATALPIDMGALALVAAFIIGLLSHFAHGRQLTLDAQQIILHDAGLKTTG